MKLAFHIQICWRAAAVRGAVCCKRKKKETRYFGLRVGCKCWRLAGRLTLRLAAKRYGRLSHVMYQYRRAGAAAYRQRGKSYGITRFRSPSLSI